MRAIIVLLFLLPACAPMSMQKAEQLIELSYFEGCVSSNGREPVVQLTCQMRAHEWHKEIAK